MDISLKIKFVEIFCHVLIGNFDRGILNFVLYLAEVIDKIDWTETDDIKTFFSVIYPFCDVDLVFDQNTKLSRLIFLKIS